MPAGAAHCRAFWKRRLTRWWHWARGRGDTVAVIGPTISQKAYEVGPEFVEEFLMEDPTTYSRFFRGRQGRPGIV